jgi:hypothetical protein
MTTLSEIAKPPRATEDHLNTGVLALRVPGEEPELRTGPITVIVSGVGRSGTSMVAKLVDALGISMGKTDGLAVYEDQELNRALYQFDYNLVRKLIRERDTAQQRWGFKFASLQNHIFAPQLEYFRNPRLIIVMRDVIATASRSFISDVEQKGFDETLINVTKQTSDMVYFVINATYPTLLVSYEKFVGLPDKGIDAVANFCGITVTDEIRRKARHAIEPNNPQYIELFHPNFRGNFDSVKQGFVLGWCAADDSQDAVEVELLADGSVLATARADIYRTDLFAAGIGAGCHGFRFDLSGLSLQDTMVLDVRTVGGTYIVKGSGRRLKDFPER